MPCSKRGRNKRIDAILMDHDSSINKYIIYIISKRKSGAKAHLAPPPIGLALEYLYINGL